MPWAHVGLTLATIVGSSTREIQGKFNHLLIPSYLPKERLGVWPGQWKIVPLFCPCFPNPHSVIFDVAYGYAAFKKGVKIIYD